MRVIWKIVLFSSIVCSHISKNFYFVMFWKWMEVVYNHYYCEAINLFLLSCDRFRGFQCFCGQSSHWSSLYGKSKLSWSNMFQYYHVIQEKVSKRLMFIMKQEQTNFSFNFSFIKIRSRYEFAIYNVLLFII